MEGETLERSEIRRETKEEAEETGEIGRMDERERGRKWEEGV